MRYRLEQFNEALDDYLYASQWYEELDQIENAAFCLEYVAIIYSEIGDWHSAGQAMQEAVARFREVGSSRLALAEETLSSMLDKQRLKKDESTG